jgi:hypothetical protein
MNYWKRQQRAVDVLVGFGFGLVWCMASSGPGGLT